MSAGVFCVEFFCAVCSSASGSRTVAAPRVGSDGAGVSELVVSELVVALAPNADVVIGAEVDMRSALRCTVGCANDKLCGAGRDAGAANELGCPRRGPRCAAGMLFSVVPEAIARTGCLALSFTISAMFSNSHHTGANVI